METDYSRELEAARTSLHRLLASARGIDPLRLVFLAPVIDRQTGTHGPHGQSSSSSNGGATGAGSAARTGLGYTVWKGDDVQGLKKFVDQLAQHAAALDTMAKSGVPPKESPYPIVAGLVTFWKQVLIARGPLPAVRLAVKGKGKEKEGFVDVVARGGEEWIRIYRALIVLPGSKKVNQLLAEFREQDSYINSDYSDEEWDDGDVPGASSTSAHAGPSARRPGLTNSIITTVDSLLDLASKFDRIPGAPVPRLTLRLSRIAEHPPEGHPDPRIEETFAAVRARGVELVFGDLSEVELDDLDAAYGEGCTTRPRYRPWDSGIPHRRSAAVWNGKGRGGDGGDQTAALPPQNKPRRPIEPLPSLKVNLDPSSMIGLCSDLLHHPLPLDEAGAKARFFRPPEHVREWRVRASEVSFTSTPSDGDSRSATGSPAPTYMFNGVEISADAVGQSQNSRELVRGLMEEVETSLVVEIRDALTEALRVARGREEGKGEGEGGGGEEIGVEFWATAEAVRYVQETISCDEVVGDGLEQRRMKRLTGLEEGDFWEGSRHKGTEGVLRNLRVKVFEKDDWPREVVPPRAEVVGLGKESVNVGVTAITTDVSSLSIGANGNGHDHGPTRDPMCRRGMRSFQYSMSNICHQYLSEYTHVTTSANPDPSILLNLANFLQPRRMPTPRVAQVSTPFPVVSVMSLERGAREGMTTLSMGNVVLRELFAQTRWRVKGWCQGNYEIEAADEAADEEERGGEAGDGDGEEKAGDGMRTWPRAHAAVWILPYRSLGEGKRVKFENGDYSYPETSEK